MKARVREMLTQRLAGHRTAIVWPVKTQDIPHEEPAFLGYSIAHLQDADFTVVSVLAMNKPRPSRLASVAITPGCDLAARLEGRG